MKIYSLFNPNNYTNNKHNAKFKGFAKIFCIPSQHNIILKAIDFFSEKQWHLLFITLILL